jgi:hypothetical protein
MKENLYGDLSLLFFFYRKGLIGVWYCNLKNLVKTTSLGHPKHIEARPQYKALTSTSQKTGRCRSHLERSKH